MKTMKVALGADAYGFELKQALAAWLRGQGHRVMDAGIDSATADERILDYADAVAGAVQRGAAEHGLLLCRSGGAMVIRANRWAGVRAVMAGAEKMIEHDRQASDVNVLCFGADGLSVDEAVARLKVFLDTPFEPLERRVKRLAALERGTG